MYFVRQMSTNVQFSPQQKPIKCHAKNCYFGLEYGSNHLSAGASPQTLLGSLQRSPDPLDVFRGPTAKERGKETG